MTTGEELIERFENCFFSQGEFRHQDHVKLAWLYLNRYSKLETLARFRKGLKNLANHLGKPELYHEKITWGHIFLIHERMLQSSKNQTWEDFAAANADLMNWREGLFRRYYSDAAISSEIARLTFILPDKLPEINSEMARTLEVSPRGSGANTEVG